MQYINIKTKLINETKYIEVAMVDGEVKTYVNEKIEEPNIYKAVEILDEDQADNYESELRLNNGISPVG